MDSTIAIFGLGHSGDYAARVASLVGAPLGRVREEWRPDSEPWAAALDNVRGRDVFVISSLYAGGGLSASDRTMQMLLFIDALKRASAGRVTAVAPYLSFMRQDRKEGSREPVSVQALAKFFEAAGADRLLTMDAHNISSLQCSFRIPIDILEANNLLADAAAGHPTLFDRPLAVLSPDAGGVKRATQFHASLQKRWHGPVGFAYANKVRSRDGVSVQKIIGDVAGKAVIMVDDMIGTGGTAGQIEAAVRGAGGTLWAVAATHGLFSGELAWDNTVRVGEIFIADTVTRPDDGEREGFTVVPTAGLFAEAVRRIHNDDGSISELLCDS